MGCSKRFHLNSFRTITLNPLLPLTEKNKRVLFCMMFASCVLRSKSLMEEPLL